MQTIECGIERRERRGGVRPKYAGTRLLLREALVRPRPEERG
jgi:hypothetical protein